MAEKAADCVSSVRGGHQPRLMEQVHNAIRRRYFSPRTEEAYRYWIRQYIYFNGKRHPAELGEPEITAFLNYLATRRKVAAATQNQALSALLFLYKHVLERELAWLDGLQRASRPVRLPTVLTRAEVGSLLGQLTGTRWLLASLLYGSGLRVMECLRLRVKDISGAGRKGRKGSRDHASRKTRRADTGTSGTRPYRARDRPAGGLWRDTLALCACTKISPCRPGVALAICLSIEKPIAGSRGPRDPPSPP